MSGNGYIPSFKMWLFSIFLAAGFGSGAVDGIKYLLIEYTKKGGNLSFVDYGCWNRGTTKKPIFTCEYIFKNTGDDTVIVTELKIGDSIHRSFHSNLPGGVRKVNFNYTNSNIAEVKPNELLVVAKSPLLKEDWNKKACLLYMEESLVCSRE
ncbi:hypothetical protein [Alteromonas gracilis]|uniref:hypothetical protein n=1 Tax=Alteromonas gracilis TaxID=1479524 RepID=UPI003734D183